MVLYFVTMFSPFTFDRDWSEVCGACRWESLGLGLMSSDQYCRIPLQRSRAFALQSTGALIRFYSWLRGPICWPVPYALCLQRDLFLS